MAVCPAARARPAAGQAARRAAAPDPGGRPSPRPAVVTLLSPQPPAGPWRHRSRPAAPASRRPVDPVLSAGRGNPQYSQLTDLCAGTHLCAGDAGDIPGARPGPAGNIADDADATGYPARTRPHRPTPGSPRRTRVHRPHRSQKWIT